MLSRLNAWLLLACVSILGITEARTQRVHVPIRVDVIVSTGKARALKGKRKKTTPKRKRAPVKKKPTKKAPVKKQPKRTPTKPQKKPSTKKPTEPKTPINQEAALKTQLAVATQRINQLTAQYRSVSLKAGQAENLAIELLEVSRRLDEANLALASGQSSARLAESFRNLNKQIDVLSFELTQQRQEAEYHKSKSKSQEQDISLFKSAVAAHITSEERFLNAYKIYQSLFSSDLEHTPETVKAARKQLLESFQSYEDAVHRYNKVLRQIGMLTHTLQVNPLYKTLLEGAMQEAD